MIILSPMYSSFSSQPPCLEISYLTQEIKKMVDACWGERNHGLIDIVYVKDRPVILHGCR